jgi:hypothetical protein
MNRPLFRWPLPHRRCQAGVQAKTVDDIVQALKAKAVEISEDGVRLVKAAWITQMASNRAPISGRKALR